MKRSYVWSLTIHNFSFVMLTQAHIEFNGYTLLTVSDVLDEYPGSSYIKCFERQYFNYKPFAISQVPYVHPHEGYLKEAFVLPIPEAKVTAEAGIIFVDRKTVVVDTCCFSRDNTDFL